MSQPEIGDVNDNAERNEEPEEKFDPGNPQVTVPVERK